VQIEELDVLIIGAGVSGIGMACRLKTECPDKSFAILERRQRIGGTWDLFRYPGVRSDSDMFTYAYRFRPWHDSRVLAAGETIRGYLADTAREHGVESHIRYGLRVLHADWSSAQQRWTVTALTEPGGQSRSWRCRQLVLGTGYYNFDAGYLPDFPGIEHYTGTQVHPQQWPEGLDCRGKRVVVIGSGATAVTLLPALAEAGAHVTMLQRSPSYLVSLPSRDALGAVINRVLPAGWAASLARKRYELLGRTLYQASRRWPQRMRALLLALTRRHLRGSADMRHFTPSYQPWDQRLCVVPDADLFKAVRSGQAEVVTDRIAGFDGTKVLLASGASLEADVMVTATGLDIQLFGGLQVFVDGQAYAPQRHMLYKGVLFEDLPNFAWIVGYTNASWTLKADLAFDYLCRLYQHMDARGLAVATPHDTLGNRLDGESIFGGLSSGYVQRATGRMPRQGREQPWRVTHHFPTDRRLLQDEPVDDGVLRFEPRRADAARCDNVTPLRRAA
jgi:cation diffusion facilitator CzcD-associated flavoprotein CzcO